MKTLIATSVLTFALVAGSNAGATEKGPISLTNTQLDTVDAGRWRNRSSSASVAENFYAIAASGATAVSRTRRGTATTFTEAAVGPFGGAYTSSYGCSGRNC